MMKRYITDSNSLGEPMRHADNSKLRGFAARESLQREVAGRLEPWLALANLAASDELQSPEMAPRELIADVFIKGLQEKHVSDFVEQARWIARLDGFKDDASGHRPPMRQVEARRFYEMFYAARSLCMELTDRAANPDQYQQEDNLKLLGYESPVTPGIKPVQVSMFGQSFSELIWIEDGVLKFQPDPLLMRLRNAFDGMELSRLRRCPVCLKFYYAVRANKGACDEHLGVARVRRLREKMPEYNANRRENRLQRKRRQGKTWINFKDVHGIRRRKKIGPSKAADEGV